jgi:two-component system, OmpR family, sensor histidine kinase KdpD
MEEIIGGALKAVHGALGARPLRVQIEPGLPLVECDAVLIERVLANLLENAGKYTTPTTPVEILVHTAGGTLQVSVRDHGPGVAAGQEETVFEKFTRGASESATPGVGLGLAICRAVMHAHRGRIWVEPTPGGGATFSFSLALGTPPTVDPAHDAQALLVHTGHTGQTGQA